MTLKPNRFETLEEFFTRTPESGYRYPAPIHCQASGFQIGSFTIEETQAAYLLITKQLGYTIDSNFTLPNIYKINAACKERFIQLSRVSPAIQAANGEYEVIAPAQQLARLINQMLLPLNAKLDLAEYTSRLMDRCRVGQWVQKADWNKQLDDILIDMISLLAVYGEVAMTKKESKLGSEFVKVLTAGSLAALLHHKHERLINQKSPLMGKAWAARALSTYYAEYSNLDGELNLIKDALRSNTRRAKVKKKQTERQRTNEILKDFHFNFGGL